MRNKISRMISRLLGRSPEPPGDPYASVRVPLRRGPFSGGAAIALTEPKPSRFWLDFRRRD